MSYQPGGLSKEGFISLVVAYSLLMVSCSYRFSNSAIKINPRKNRIAVEAIYDTSRNVVPHQKLWEAIQAEIAKNGRLYLTSVDHADYIMRVHLKEADVKPLPVGRGTLTSQRMVDDPDSAELSSPSALGELDKNAGIATPLSRLDVDNLQEMIMIQVEVVVYDVAKRRELWSRSYKRPTSNYGLREASSPQRTEFLRADEKKNATFEADSKIIGQWIVKDLLPQISR